VLVANCSAMPQGFFTWQVTDNPELGLFRVKLTRNAHLAEMNSVWPVSPSAARCGAGIESHQKVMFVGDRKSLLPSLKN